MNLKRPDLICKFIVVLTLVSCVVLAAIFQSPTTGPPEPLEAEPEVSALGDITFRVCDKTPEKVKLITGEGHVRHESTHSDDDLSLVTHFKAYQKNNCTRVIQGTVYGADGGRVVPAGENGFISTVLQAYAGHQNLVIRPDDIWIAIISQFALYIDASGEKFRDRFVEFDGKKRLIVNITTTNLFTVSYTQFVELMSSEIHKNIIDKRLRDWITPNFTTTTRDDKVAAGIILMATLKQFFEYVLDIACGIPKITLEGTVDDWKEIATRLVKLRTYELESWVDNLLSPIVDQFIKAKLGNVDTEFWSKIVNLPIFCGGSTITGWITAFSVFNEFGYADRSLQRGVWKYQKWPTINIDKLASGVAYADIIICDHGVRHDSVAFAGHIGQQILQDGYTLKPRIGWAIALRNSTGKSSEVDGVTWDDLCEKIQNVRMPN